MADECDHVAGIQKVTPSALAWPLYGDTGVEEKPERGAADRSACGHETV
jgi:hypothetical protein